MRLWVSCYTNKVAMLPNLCPQNLGHFELCLWKPKQLNINCWKVWLITYCSLNRTAKPGYLPQIRLLSKLSDQLLNHWPLWLYWCIYIFLFFCILWVCDPVMVSIYRIYQMPPRQLPTLARQGLKFSKCLQVRYRIRCWKRYRYSTVFPVQPEWDTVIFGKLATEN